MARHLGDHLKIAVIILLIAAIAYNLFSEDGAFKISNDSITGATAVPVIDPEVTQLSGEKVFNAVIAVLVLLLIGLGGYYIRVRKIAANATAEEGTTLAPVTGNATGIDPDLSFYIREARRVGYGDDQITSRLHRAGWVSKDIKAALKAERK